jgi:Zn-dependent peptidase ImmA (M78 family)/transcriptional regulator with XRE-family HTH domain
METFDTLVSMTTVDIGKRIAALREGKMTGEQLGERLGISKSEVSKIENGSRKLDIGYLALIAEIFEISLGELLGIERHGSLAMAARVMTYPDGEEAMASRQRIRQVLEADASLTSSVGLRTSTPSTAGLAVFQRVRDEDLAGHSDPRMTGELLARVVREELGLGRAPIADIAELAELHFGIDVVSWPTGKGVSGLLVKGDEVALMLVSSSFPKGHQRFTAAHEICHYLLSDPENIIFEHELFDKESHREKRANAFAECFLLPMEGLAEVIGGRGIDPSVIAELMRHFGVSYQGLIWRLRSIQILSSREANTWFEKTAGAVLALANDQAPEELTRPTEERRLPPRLWRAAEKGYVSGRVGLGVLSMLTEEPSEELFNRLAAKGVVPPSAEDDYLAIEDSILSSNA